MSTLRQNLRSGALELAGDRCCAASTSEAPPPPPPLAKGGVGLWASGRFLRGEYFGGADPPARVANGPAWLHAGGASRARVGFARGGSSPSS